MSAMYSASIDKLRLVLSAMQSSSAKRADLEQRLRGQLELRLQQLQQPKENLEVTGDERERVKLLEITVTALEANVVKVTRVLTHIRIMNKPHGVWYVDFMVCKCLQSRL